MHFSITVDSKYYKNKENKFVYVNILELQKSIFIVAMESKSTPSNSNRTSKIIKPISSP